ncbi:hypothetical protein L873DRAFT_1811518 [Choiromyces venosus 120613-1]|uniref:Uncharacterized protein n=1 Tax=Choiromyces venosus 120613-1 TaxID=1336337 RepID=A0A3N4JDN3_9PEZI|nr:hypothetical protein L873DRAFT_1811518 [Choiromyces venosus 120613-1]
MAWVQVAAWDFAHHLCPQPHTFIGGPHEGRIAAAGGSCSAVIIHHSPPLWG